MLVTRPRSRSAVELVATRVALVVLCLGLVPACRDGGSESDEPGHDASAPAGDGGQQDAPPSCGCGALEQCFGADLCVAKLIAVGGGFSIDATEVTRAQYAAWLATNPVVADQPPACAGWNVTYVPESSWPERGCTAAEWPPGERGQYPVVCVDWCDAYAYCKSVGKRLCGSIAGGPNAYADHEDASRSQWFNACSSGGTYDFPYGDTFAAQSCNGHGSAVDASQPVAASVGCQSPANGYAGVFDLSGNVREWEDSCSSTEAYAPCHTRGGGFGDDYYSGLRCNDPMYAYRDHLWGVIGFRCCSP